MLKPIHIYPVSVMSLPSWEPSPRFSVGLAPRKEQGWGPLRLWSSHRGDVMDILKVLGEFSLPQCSQTTCWFTGWRYFFGWGNTPSPIWRILSQNPKFQWIITVTGGPITQPTSIVHGSWKLDGFWLLLRSCNWGVSQKAFPLPGILFCHLIGFTHV